MNPTKVFDFCFLLVDFFFLLHNELLLWVPLKLLSFYIFEHKFAFRNADIVWKNFRISFVKLNEFRHSWFTFLLFVLSLQELTYVIKDQVVFENTNNMWVFIVNDVIYDFCIVIFFWSQILLFKIISNHLRSVNEICSNLVHTCNWNIFRRIWMEV